MKRQGEDEDDHIDAMKRQRQDAQLDFTAEMQRDGPRGDLTSNEWRHTASKEWEMMEAARQMAASDKDVPRMKKHLLRKERQQQFGFSPVSDVNFASLFSEDSQAQTGTVAPMSPRVAFRIMCAADITHDEFQEPSLFDALFSSGELHWLGRWVVGGAARGALENQRPRDNEGSWPNPRPDRSWYFCILDCFVVIAQTIAQGRAPISVTYGEMVALLIVFERAWMITSELKNIDAYIQLRGPSSASNDSDDDAAVQTELMELRDLLIGGCIREGWLEASFSPQSLQPKDPSQWFVMASGAVAYFNGQLEGGDGQQLQVVDVAQLGGISDHDVGLQHQRPALTPQQQDMLVQLADQHLMQNPFLLNQCHQDATRHWITAVGMQEH